MKPIFGIDVTTNKKNNKMNGEEFITRVVSDTRRAVFEEKTNKFDGAIKKGQLPSWLTVTKFISGIWALLALTSVISSKNADGSAENITALTITGIIGAVIWIGVIIYSGLREKAVLKDENIQGQIDEINTYIDDIYNELGVPTTAPFVDVLVFRYAEKDGEIKIKTAPMQMADRFNLQFKAYVKDGYLHLSNLDDTHSFKMSELKTIKKVKKSTTLSSWNKETEPTDERYKPYKITSDQYGIIHIKWYYILEMEHNGEIYGLYFPSYELEAFEILTGLHVEE